MTLGARVPCGNWLVCGAGYPLWVCSGLFWLVGTLSAMTAWMLIATWPTPPGIQAQQAWCRNNFRRDGDLHLTGMPHGHGVRINM